MRNDCSYFYIFIFLFFNFFHLPLSISSQKFFSNLEKPMIIAFVTFTYLLWGLYRLFSFLLFSFVNYKFVQTQISILKFINFYSLLFFCLMSVMAFVTILILNFYKKYKFALAISFVPSIGFIAVVISDILLAVSE